MDPWLKQFLNLGRVPFTPKVDDATKEKVDRLFRAGFSFDIESNRPMGDVSIYCWHSRNPRANFQEDALRDEDIPDALTRLVDRAHAALAGVTS